MKSLRDAPPKVKFTSDERTAALVEWLQTTDGGYYAQLPDVNAIWKARPRASQPIDRQLRWIKTATSLLGKGPAQDDYRAPLAARGHQVNRTVLGIFLARGHDWVKHVCTVQELIDGPQSGGGPIPAVTGAIADLRAHGDRIGASSLAGLLTDVANGKALSEVLLRRLKRRAAVSPEAEAEEQSGLEEKPACAQEIDQRSSDEQDQLTRPQELSPTSSSSSSSEQSGSQDNEPSTTPSSSSSTEQSGPEEHNQPATHDDGQSEEEGDEQSGPENNKQSSTSGSSSSSSEQAAKEGQQQPGTAHDERSLSSSSSSSSSSNEQCAQQRDEHADTVDDEERTGAAAASRGQAPNTLPKNAGSHRSATRSCVLYFRCAVLTVCPLQ